MKLLPSKSSEASYHRIVLIGIIFFEVLVTSSMANPNERSIQKAEISSSAQEVFDRMHTQWTTDFDTATGGYVLRIFNNVTEENTKALAASIRRGLEEAKSFRIANEKTLGRKVDEAALNAQVEADVKEALSKLSGRGLQTFAKRYFRKGDAYRIEQFSLPNDISLEKLCDDLETGQIHFEPSYICTWNGKQYAEIVGAKSNVNSEKAFATLSYKNRGKLPNFTNYARDTAADPTLLKKLADQGFPVTTAATRTEEGDYGVLLQVGSPKSVSMYLEATVLPTKGYCTYSASLKGQGAVVSRDEYRNFVQAVPGFWLPLKIMREAYKLDASKVPYLSSREELLAFEAPQIDVPLDNALFDLAGSREWKSLPLSTHLLPKNAPYIKKPASRVPPTQPNRTILIAINIIVLAALLGFWCYRRVSRKNHV